MQAMTLIATPIFVGSRAEVSVSLERAREAAGSGANMIEWRVDGLAEDPDGAQALIELVAGSPLPCIVTCRPTWEGGRYGGDEAQRISLFEALASSAHQAKYLDIELAAWERSANFRQKAQLAIDHPRQVRAIETGLILSTHDFEKRPRDLLQRIERMVNVSASVVIKVAWMARSLRDNLEAFDLLRERRKPMIALCMGRFGLMSRVLAPKFGGMITFASETAGGESAPGQPTITELRKRYRFDSIRRRTKVYGVIGWPVEQSRGPEVHNAGFEAAGHDGVYLPMPIPPEYEHFKATVGAMIDHRRLDFRGASVTLPHKENLLRFVLECGGRTDGMSERIGAANTLMVGSAGATACSNTDCPAIVDSLCTAMSIDAKDLAELRIAVLGAGGVARAAIGALTELGAPVVVFNRTKYKAQALAEEFNRRGSRNGDWGEVHAGRAEQLRDGFHVIINCTPVGMAGGSDPDGSPLEALGQSDALMDDRVTVFDTVYEPARTRLIEEAAARGARVVMGVEMFINQAARQFALWTGKAAPVEVFREMLNERG